MITSTEFLHSDLDWDQMWQNAQRSRGWASSTASEWDAKSAAFAVRNSESDRFFAEDILAKLPLEPSMTVLDVGAGPGTLSLPIASRVARVHALDYSGGMLSILKQRAQQAGLTNILQTHCSWEDDWQAYDIGIYDMVIACRSLNVSNLHAALTKVDKHCRKMAVLVDRVSPTPFDPKLFAAIGRPFQSGPDYIYTLNMLYSMGIFPDISILVNRSEKKYADIEEAVQSVSWMLKKMDADEQEQLRSYFYTHCQHYDAAGKTYFTHTTVGRWAMISWRKSS